MRQRVPVAILAIVLLAGCSQKKTEVVSRPELPLPKEVVAAKKAVDPGPQGPAAWVERPGPPADGHYFAAASGDFTGDGLRDLAAGSFEPGGVAFWIARDDATWKYSFVSLPSSQARDVEVADVDRDGRDDVIVASRGGIDEILVFTKIGSTGWDAGAPAHAAPGYESITVGDLNEDGWPDIVASRGDEGPEGGLEILLGDGTGGFQESATPINSGPFRDVLLRDLDGDGHLDLLAAGWGIDGGIYVYFGDGTGALRGEEVFGPKMSYRGLTLGDVDHDGNLDLVSATYMGGVRVFLREDAGVRECSVIEEGSFWDALVTDADGDGRSEVYASSSDGLGVVGWTLARPKDCRFERVVAGLPGWGVWYGLHHGSLGAEEAPTLVTAGFSGGLRYFRPTALGVEEEKRQSYLRASQERMEEAWASGNDAFTTAMGFDEYRVGVGDTLQIRVLAGEQVQEIEVAVQSDGEIFLPVPGLGSVPADGSSPTQLKNEILERARTIWRSPQVEVVVLKYRAHAVSILGEVRTTARVDSGPGRYSLEGKSRVVDFLSEHGGPTERADLNRVQMIRADGRSSYLNLNRAIFASDLRENPILNTGDTVFVPSVGQTNRKVFVLGAVTNPGLLELRENISLLEAISRAGGFTDKARLQQCMIVRGGLTHPELVNVNLKDILERGDLSGDLTLRNGDLVYIPRKKIWNVREFFMAVQPALDFIISSAILTELVRE